MKPLYKPTGPDNYQNYILLGFILSLVILVGGLYLVTEGIINLDKLPTGGWTILIILIPLEIMNLIFWNKHKNPGQLEVQTSPEESEEESEEEFNKIIQSEKTIGIMTGVSYLYLTIIIGLILIPTIALVVLKIRGEI